LNVETVNAMVRDVLASGAGMHFHFLRDRYFLQDCYFLQKGGARFACKPTPGHCQDDNFGRTGTRVVVPSLKEVWWKFG
jgi:hypothetical protein